MGVPQNIMCMLCTVMRPDHFKLASYGPVVMCCSICIVMHIIRIIRQGMQQLLHGCHKLTL